MLDTFVIKHMRAARALASAKSVVSVDTLVLSSVEPHSSLKAISFLYWSSASRQAPFSDRVVLLRGMSGPSSGVEVIFTPSQLNENARNQLPDSVMEIEVGF